MLWASVAAGVRRLILQSDARSERLEVCLLTIPNRINPDPDIFEYRFRNSHARVQLSYKLSFGGGGVAK